MRKETVYKACLALLLLGLAALHVDAIFLRGLDLKFSNEISVEGIFSVLVTILLALYVAHVVEAGREQKQSQNNLLEHIWQTSYDSTKDLAEKLELSKCNYLYMTAWPKRMTSFLDNAKKILEDKGSLSEEISSQLQKISEDNKTLRGIITTISPKKQSADNYLEVKKNEIIAIAPKRQEEAMLLVSSIQSEILSIWTDTVV